MLSRDFDGVALVSAAHASVRRKCWLSPHIHCPVVVVCREAPTALERRPAVTSCSVLRVPAQMSGGSVGASLDPQWNRDQ